MKNTKRLFIALVAAAVLGLAACGMSSRSKSATSSGGGSAEQAAPAEQTETASSKYAVTIDSARVTEDYSGDPAVVIAFTFTNNSDDKANFMFATNVDVFQNGVELDTAIVSGTESNSLNDIKPGASIQTEQAFSLNDMSDIEVEVSELLSFSDDLLATKTFTLE